ncbi:MAG: efflux RND transporter permease subunit [Limisphaerales bacterium]
MIPVIDIYGNIDGRDLGGVLNEIEPLIEKIKKDLPRGSSIVMRGQAETMRSSYLGLGVGLVMAIVLIYFLLVVNFQSWLDPFIIITALPGALAGRGVGIIFDPNHLERSRIDGRHHESRCRHCEFRSRRFVCARKFATRP